MLTYLEFELVIDRALKNFVELIAKGNATRARSTIASTIVCCRHVLERPSSPLSVLEKSNLMIMAIFCVACRDYADCHQYSDRVLLNSSETELLWGHLIDCLDRLKFVTPSIQGPVVRWLINRASELENNLQKQFGPGLYCSPEIVLKEELCSICNEDFRRCAHQSGKIYNGSVCQRIARIESVRGVGLVTDPVDRRCRIWPWNTDKHKRILTSVTIITAFNASDLSDPRQSRRPKKRRKMLK
jgi:hypothetical protein